MAKTITFAIVDAVAVERITFDPIVGGWSASITYLSKSTQGEVITRDVYTKALGAGANTQINTWLASQLTSLNTDKGLT